MIYKEELLREHCRSTIDRIARAVGDSPRELKKIIKIIFEAEAPLPQRASWLLAVINKNHPELFLPWLQKFAETVDTFTVDAVKRNMLTVLASHPLPEESEAMMIDKCFHFLNDLDEPIAVRALSLEILGNLAKKYPPLYNEIKAVTDSQKDFASPAMKVKTRRIFGK